MTTAQTGDRALSHELGFQNEALIKDHVKDLNGIRYDLLIMACEAQTFLSTRDAYGDN
ncbi:MAG: hypothetical protein VCB07_09685 [Gammaproteobacteria bacterium]